MNTIIANKPRAFLFGLCCALVAATSALADDTEIFFAGVHSTGKSVNPNILMIMDTSGSMSTTVSGTGMSRLANLQKAFNTIIDNTSNVNIGLMRFNDPGGPILYPATDTSKIIYGDSNLTIPVAASSDDAEQNGSAVSLTDPHLQMAYGTLTPPTTLPDVIMASTADNAAETISSGSVSTYSSGSRLVMSNGYLNGLFFPSVAIPVGATITSAVIKFTGRNPSSGNNSDDVFLQYYGDANASYTGTAGSFTTAASSHNISSRTKTTAVSLPDSPDTWVQGTKYNSPDLSSIVQEIVSKPGWASGHNLVLIEKYISGAASTSQRVAYSSYGSINARSPTLTITYVTTPPAAQTVGLRFTNVAIPQGATITSANLVFISAGANSATDNLTIKGEASDSAATYTTASNNITGRATTGASMPWAPDPWAVGDQVSSPDLSSVVQEIVNRSGWCGGSSMAFQISGTDAAQRIAYSYEGDPAQAPVLQVTYDPSSITASNGCVMKTPPLFQVNASANDAQETNSSGNMSVTGSSNPLILDNSRTTGLRFTNVAIPQGSTIQSANLIYVATNTESGSQTFTLKAEAADNSAVFSTSGHNISSRATTGSVPWTVGNWTAGSPYTQDITTLIQAVVNRSGWNSGNALSIIQTASTSSQRHAQSYDSAAGAAASLTVTFKVTGTAAVGANTVGETLKSIVAGFTPNGYTPTVDTLYEGALYYQGKNVKYGLTRGNAGASGRVSNSLSYTGGTDVLPTGCTSNNLNASACKTEKITGSPKYVSPVTDPCQKNYVVLLTDGEANQNNSTALIPAMISPQTCSSANTNGISGGLCGLELAKWMNDGYGPSNKMNLGPNGTSGNQNVQTFTIGFNLSTDPAAQAWLSNVATAGGGTFKTADNADDLISAFKSILWTIKSVNTTFVAPGATVNQFNRLQDSDELYYSLFKPEATPTWEGNLKRYGINTTDEIVDVTGAVAVDPISGYFYTTAKSWWSPTVDGDQVAQGGAASKLPTPLSTRNVYTNTGAGTTNVNLTATGNMLDPSNSAITTTMLGNSSMTTTYRNNLLLWARGYEIPDFTVDASSSTSSLTSRNHIGDPIHSQPLIITYGGTAADPDMEVFFGENEGFLHAISSKYGTEDFAYIPQELLPHLATFQQNLEASPHPYGMDGPITSWIKDANKNGIVESGDGDTAYIYAGMRRGGNNYYALDVSSRTSPQLLWEIKGGSGDFTELGQTWSSPIHTQIKLNGTIKDVLIFAGGYDTNQDTASTRTADSVGRAIYIVNANDGTKIWSGGPASIGFDKKFSQMVYSIPSDIKIVDINQDGLADEMYVGDMGGQIWRFDINNTATTTATLVTGGVIADLNDGTATGNRRFYYPPDVALISSGTNHFMSIAVGSGWREHPLDQTVVDRFYMIRNTDIYQAPSSYTTLTEADLYDTTLNLIGQGTATEKTTATAALASAHGWYITLADTGEKVLAPSITFNSNVLFTTYTPVASDSSCAAAIGIGRYYDVNVLDGTPEQNLDGGPVNVPLTVSDRSMKLAHGGIPPSPLLLFEQNASGGTSADIVVGTETPIPPTGNLGKRTYWIDNAH